MKLRTKTKRRLYYIKRRIEKGLKISKKSGLFLKRYQKKGIDIHTLFKKRLKRPQQAKEEIQQTFHIKGKYDTEDANHTIDFEISISSKSVNDVKTAKEKAEVIIKEAEKRGYPLSICSYEIGVENKEGVNEVKIRGLSDMYLTKLLRRLVE